MREIQTIVLRDRSGAECVLPGERYVLLALTGPDCHACELTLPLMVAANDAFGGAIDLYVVSADARFAEFVAAQVEGRVPVLIDERGQVATALESAAMPHIALVSPDGSVVAEFTGFNRGEWQSMFERLISKALAPAPLMDWSQLPVSEPGCEFAPAAH